MNDSKLKIEEYRMSPQFIGATMMALQKCLLEESDITEIFKTFRLALLNGEVVVLNPPLVKIAHQDDQEPSPDLSAFRE